MNTEEKAKRYDEALEVCKKLYNEAKADGYTSDIEDYEQIFPELKESEDERIRKWIYKLLEELSNGENSSEKELMIIKAQDWIEKQGEQKPTDKVEPKFKVGDWVIFNNHHESIYQIEKIENYRYFLRHYLGGTMSIHFDNELIRLWTIYDAKSGDIIYTPKGCGVEGIFLIEGWKKVEDTGRTLCSDIGYRVEDDEIIAGGLGAIWWEGVIDPFYPATKEQRDTLMKAMADAGYTFDFDKKQLKKISDKSLAIEPNFKEGDVIREKETGNVFLVNSVEDFGYTLHYKNCTAKGCTMSFKDEDKYELVEQKPAWSEEDEEILDGIIVDVEVLKEQDRTKTGKAAYQKEIDWLKSLKDRVQPQWKPSDEQMNALNDVISSRDIKYDVLSELWKDLKKLREEYV